MLRLARAKAMRHHVGEGLGAVVDHVGHCHHGLAHVVDNVVRDAAARDAPAPPMVSAVL